MPLRWKGKATRSRRTTAGFSKCEMDAVTVQETARRPASLDLSKPTLYLFAAILLTLIALPMSWLFVFGFTDRTRAFTLENFQRLFTDPSFLDPLITTAIIATSSAVICCAVAAPMGWLVARTDMPFGRTVRALVTASFVTPPFLGAIAWEILAAPNSGLLNQWYRELFGLDAYDNFLDIYTTTGLIFVMACYAFPYVFVLVA